MVIYFLAILCALSVAAYSQDVLTYHDNNARNGLDSNETMLTLSNVNTATFGKLFTIAANGAETHNRCTCPP